MIHRAVVAVGVGVLFAVIGGAAAQESITDPFPAPPALQTTPACVTDLDAVLQLGLPLLQWTHEYALSTRQDHNADFVIYRAGADFTIEADEEGAVWLANYPQFVEVARFDAWNGETYVDAGAAPGGTYRYFVSYDHGIPADRCPYIQIGPDGGFSSASESGTLQSVPGLGAPLLALAAVAAALLARRALK